MSTESFWASRSRDERERIIAEEHERVVRAREDIVAFFDYVMREENKKHRIRCAPHQRVALDFVMHHDRSLLVLPVGTSKSFMMACVTLFLLGRDNTTRGAIVSATQVQAEKVLAMVADYVESSAALHRVFPHLRKSRRPRDKWNQTAITVDRPPGIRDASLYAVGTHGALAGSRLNWIIVDDILDFENTSTNEARQKVCAWFDSTVLTRLDPVGARIVMSNTPWHPDDLVHVLERHGWPALRMDVLGNVLVQDDAQWMLEGKPPWEARGLRPATRSPEEVRYRLSAHDPDPDNAEPLWKERYPAEEIERLRAKHPLDFARMYLCVARDDATAMCKREWIDLCLQRAREAKHYSLVARYEGPNLTFTGVDLAVGLGEHHDETAFFTFEVLEDGTRKILDIDCGRWQGPEIRDRLVRKQADYNSIVCVESNSAQMYIKQFVLDVDKSLPVKAHMTGRAKAHPEYGVAGLFVEFSNGAWLIPNGPRGDLHPMVQKFVDACLYYSPSKHTADVLMASYMGREQARKWGVLSKKPKGNGGGSIQSSLLSR